MQTTFRDTSFLRRDNWARYESRHQDFTKAMEEVNFNTITLVCEGQSKLYDAVNECLRQLLNHSDTYGTVPEGKQLKEFYGNCTQVYNLDKWIYGAAWMPKDDVFHKPEDHPDVKQIMAVTTEVILGDDDIVYEQTKNVFRTANIGMGTASRSVH